MTIQRAIQTAASRDASAASGDKENFSGKQTRRFLKSISRRAAVELSQLKEIPNAPPALDDFYHVMASVFVENNPQEILHPGAGDKKTIGIYCMLVPEELIYAAGAVPIRLCAGSFESTHIGEDRVPRDGCPLVKSSMGFSAQKGFKVFDLCDVVIIPTTCDAKRKLGEELSAFKNVWMLEVPHIKDTDLTRGIWLEQLYGLKAALEKHMGNGWHTQRITARRLGQSVKHSAEAQWAARELLSLRRANPPVIWGRQAITVMNAYAYTPVTAWTEAVTRLNRQLSDKAGRADAVCSKDKPRIYIAGSPAIFPNLKIATLVEEMGGIVVADESCAGDRYLYDPVGSTENNLRDQMAGIASRYLAPCVCPSFTPNDDRLIMIQRMVADFAVDGILYHVLKGCVVYDFEVHRVENALKSSKRPLLRIETDYTPEDVEQLRTRIEAFLEMLKSRKKENPIMTEGT
jgi:benzoyl-CoA reductase/2-hydroxyglutaryl-CoA dehydratase subunit BcrC/BadD/HgdB